MIKSIIQNYFFRSLDLQIIEIPELIHMLAAISFLIFPSDKFIFDRKHIFP